MYLIQSLGPIPSTGQLVHPYTWMYDRPKPKNEVETTYQEPEGSLESSLEKLGDGKFIHYRLKSFAYLWSDLLYTYV